MTQRTRNAALLLALLMILSALLVACQPAVDPGTPDTTDESVTEGQTNPAAPEDEYKLPLEEGYNQVTFYWTYNGSYENCDMWIWWGDVVGKGYLFHECAYGAKVVVNVPENITQVGFIVRKDCSEPGGTAWGNATKDFDQDRFVTIEGKETFVYLKPGDGNQYKSDDGGKTLYMIKDFSLAGMADQHKIEYRVSPKITIKEYSQVKVYEGDRELKVVGISTMGREAATGYIEVEEALDLSKSYRVEIEGYGSKTVVPMDIFDSK